MFFQNKTKQMNSISYSFNFVLSISVMAAHLIFRLPAHAKFKGPKVEMRIEKAFVEDYIFDSNSSSDETELQKNQSISVNMMF